MDLKIIVLVVIFGLVGCIQSDVSNLWKHKQPGNIRFYDGDHEYGYVEVRKGAFMFWWLYYAGGDKTTAYEKPLIIYVQGGPGIPASGVGNFVEIGPQNNKLQSRNSSWVHKRNVLFIDSPVGTGFSYVTKDSLLVRTDFEVARDLVQLTKQFLNEFPKFQNVPTHIFSQSYGGKIAPRYAYYLHEQIRSGTLKMNLKTVGLGSAFVSPKHYEITYPDFLYKWGYIDQNNRTTLKDLTIPFVKAYNDHNYEEAYYLHTRIAFHTRFYAEVRPFNGYNVIKKGTTAHWDLDQKNHERFMNNDVKPYLADVVPSHTTWIFYNYDVYDNLRNDTMRPSMNFVEKLLNETNINITVYNGRYDFVTCIPGALKWVHALRWRGAEQFKVASRQRIPGHENGHFKRYDRLSFWWINKAGHSISYDNPEAMEHILSAYI